MFFIVGNKNWYNNYDKKALQLDQFYSTGSYSNNNNNNVIN